MKKKFECKIRQFGDDFPASMINSEDQASGDLFSGLTDISLSRTGKSPGSKSETVLVAGKNFGQGHIERNLFVNLKNSGTMAIVADSIARDFYRGAVNHGIAVIENAEAKLKFQDGESIVIDLESCEIKSSQNVIKINSVPDLHYKIYLAGGLIPYTRKLMGK